MIKRFEYLSLCYEQLYDCRNHIRVIQPIGSDSNKLYICGTNAHNPKDWVINVSINVVLISLALRESMEESIE